MANLKRYRLFRDDQDGVCFCRTSERDDGEYVKFADIAELLNPAPNSDLMQLLRDIKERVDIDGGFNHDDFSVYQRLDAVVAQQH